MQSHGADSEEAIAEAFKEARGHSHPRLPSTLLAPHPLAPSHPRPNRLQQVMKEQEQKIMALEEHLHALGGASRAHEETVQSRGGLAPAAKSRFGRPKLG